MSESTWESLIRLVERDLKKRAGDFARYETDTIMEVVDHHLDQLEQYEVEEMIDEDPSLVTNPPEEYDGPIEAAMFHLFQRLVAHGSTLLEKMDTTGLSRGETIIEIDLYSDHYVIVDQDMESDELAAYEAIFI